VPVLGADLLGDVGVVLHGPHRRAQEVLEVDHALGALGLLVGREDLGDPGRLEGRVAGRLGGGDLVLVRLDEARLGPLDLGRQVTGRGAVGAHAGPGGGQGDQPGLALHQLRQGAAGQQPGREEAHLPQGGRVERAGLDALDTEPDQPGAQLGGGPRGERHGEHVPGGDVAGEDPVGDAVGDRARLAGTGAGQDADRTGRGRHRRPLLLVEPGQDPLDRVDRHS
jgi:hypothetical protein